MGLFSGKLFDFNDDGEVSCGEELFGIGVVGAILTAAEEEQKQAEFEAREAELEELEEKLSDLEIDMPDPDSRAYSIWEKACEDLEAEIDKLSEELYG